MHEMVAGLDLAAGNCFAGARRFVYGPGKNGSLKMHRVASVFSTVFLLIYV